MWVITMDILHTDIILFEIINFYNKLTNEDNIDINNLKIAFINLIKSINETENTLYNFNFNESLELFINKYSNYLELDDNILYFADLDSLEDELANDIELSFIDDLIFPKVESADICEALDIPIPYEETEEYFALNSKIMQTYLNIASFETKGITISFLISYLESLINDLKTKINNQDEITLLKINLCISKYNSTLNDDGLFTSTGWHIALFSSKKEEIQKLRYERLARLIEEEKYEQENGEEILSNTYEIPTFLTYFLLELNKYINTITSKNLKNELIIKKYLLLSTPELINIEDYYLNNYTLDYLELPELSKYPKTAFDVLLEPVNMCALSLDYSNKELIKSTYNMTNLIINALFVKTFLTLSQNEKEKHKIIELIRNSRFYNYPEFYSITINIINDIIFKETPKLER